MMYAELLLSVSSMRPPEKFTIPEISGRRLQLARPGQGSRAIIQPLVLGSSKQRQGSSQAWDFCALIDSGIETSQCTSISPASYHSAIAPHSFTCGLRGCTIGPAMLLRSDSKRSDGTVWSLQLQRIVRCGCRPLNVRNIIQLISLWQLDAWRLIVGHSFNLAWLYVTLRARWRCSDICHIAPLRNFSPFPCWPLTVSPCDEPEPAVHRRSLNYLMHEVW